MTLPEELESLANVLDAERAILCAMAVHAKLVGDNTEAESHTRRAISSKHYAAVCRESAKGHRKLKPKLTRADD